jgi:hypothetical protein
VCRPPSDLQRCSLPDPLSRRPRTGLGHWANSCVDAAMARHLSVRRVVSPRNLLPRVPRRTRRKRTTATRPPLKRQRPPAQFWLLLRLSPLARSGRKRPFFSVGAHRRSANPDTSELWSREERELITTNRSAKFQNPQKRGSRCRTPRPICRRPAPPLPPGGLRIMAPSSDPTLHIPIPAASRQSLWPEAGARLQLAGRSTPPP